jgi:tetratricopeptide (TPR) repeat protein
MPLKLTILQFLVPGLVTLVALAAESPTPSPRLSYGMELLRQGRVDEAIEVLNAENKAHPNNPILLNTFGAAFCLKNRPGDALPLFQEALRLNQGFRPALKNLAIAEFNLERYDSAISHFETLLRFPETRAEANLFLGMIASARLRDGDAIRYFGEAGELSSREPRAHISFIRSLCRAGDAARGGAMIDALQKRADLSAGDELDAAAAFSDCGRNNEALDELVRAETLNPALPGLAYERVDLLAKAGRTEEAIRFAQEATLRSPDGQILTLLAQIAEKAGKLDVAIDALRKLIQIEPASEDHYIDLSLLCTKYRNNGLALEIIDLGLRRMPHSYRLLVQRGITLEHSDKHAEARESFSEAIALTPDHPVALAALAVSDIMSDRISDALIELRSGVGQFPKDFYLHYLYGYALDRSRSDAGANRRALQMAVAQFDVAITLNPRFSAAYYHLGKLYAETNPKAAIHNLEMAVKLDPSAVGAKYQLARLYLKSGNSQAGAKLMDEVDKAKAASLELEQKPSLVVIEGRSTP